MTGPIGLNSDLHRQQIRRGQHSSEDLDLNRGKLTKTQCRYINDDKKAPSLVFVCEAHRSKWVSMLGRGQSTLSKFCE